MWVLIQVPGANHLLDIELLDFNPIIRDTTEQQDLGPLGLFVKVAGYRDSLKDGCVAP